MGVFRNTAGLTGLGLGYLGPEPISEDDYARRRNLSRCVRSNSDYSWIEERHRRKDFEENHNRRPFGMSLMEKFCATPLTTKAFLPDFNCGIHLEGYNHRGQATNIENKKAMLMCAAILSKKNKRERKKSTRFVAVSFGVSKVNRVIPYLNVNATYI